MRAAAGAIVLPNGAFWPYRLITGLWGQLYAQRRSRLAIETHTPVTQVQYDAGTDPTHPYVLHTPRGVVRAAKVIHATNGHAGHLLPRLRGTIFPVRGTMSTQKATPEFGRQGHRVSWSVVNRGAFDAATGTLELGLYYGSQNPHTGDIFLGGEKAPVGELLVGDDSRVGARCAHHLATVLPRLFPRGGWADGAAPPVVVQVWSGIMGVTADRLPLVGRLPRCVTDRGDGDDGGDGDGEWIAAGFNGYGMPLCWSAGEAVAQMLLGVDASNPVPDAFLATEERLRDRRRMATGLALELLLGGRP